MAASGGSRNWRGGHAGSGELLSCSFCGSNQKQVKKLIAGPNAYICGRCIDRAHTVLATGGTAAVTGTATIRLAGAEDREWCSFCGKSRLRVQAIAATGDARICNECLDLCREVIAEA